MLEPPPKHTVILTQVLLAEPQNCSNRVTLTAYVETLQMNKPQIDNDFQSVNYETLLASFCPNDQPVKQINFGFTETDICYLQANSGALIINGYIKPNDVKYCSL